MCNKIKRQVCLVVLVALLSVVPGLFADDRPTFAQVGAFTHQLLPYISPWDFLILNNGDKPPEGWEQEDFTGFECGGDEDRCGTSSSPFLSDQAFSAVGDERCALRREINDNENVAEQDVSRTEWPLNTDLILRNTILIPRGARQVRIMISVDNDILDVFLGGEPLIAEPITHDHCPVLDEFRVDVPSDLLEKLGERPISQLLAIRVSDRGEQSYFDARVLAEIPSEKLDSYWLQDSEPGFSRDGALWKAMGDGDFDSILSDEGNPFQGLGNFDEAIPTLAVDPLGFIYTGIYTGTLSKLVVIDRRTGDRQPVAACVEELDIQLVDVAVDPSTRKLFVTSSFDLFEVDPASHKCRKVRENLNGAVAVAVDASGKILVGTNEGEESFLYMIDPIQSAGSTRVDLSSLCSVAPQFQEELRDLAVTDHGDILILSKTRLFWLSQSKERCEGVSNFFNKVEGPTSSDLISVATQGSRTLVTGFTRFGEGAKVFSLVEQILDGNYVEFDNRSLHTNSRFGFPAIAIPPIPALVDGPELLVQKIAETFDEAPVPNGPGGTRTVLLSFTNNTTDTLFVVYYKVEDLSSGSLLLNGDGGPTGEGATLSEMKKILPGQTIKADFTIGVSSSDPLVFRVGVFANRSPEAQP